MPEIQSQKCISPNCGFIIPHEIGISCYNKVCQKCGIMMKDKKSTNPSVNFSG